jgi:hypothetical protein
MAALPLKNLGVAGGGVLLLKISKSSKERVQECRVDRDWVNAEAAARRALRTSPR